MDETKKVVAADDIVFEKEGITILKGKVFFIESVSEQEIILYTINEQIQKIAQSYYTASFMNASKFSLDLAH